MDLEGMVATVSNYKSKIIEWAQRENKRTEFKVLQIHGNQRFKEFVVELEVNGEPIAQGKGPTKKKAEQEAAKNASDQLQIIL
jgi:ribonuclease-3